MPSLEARTGVVLLAAGQGKRFGGAKLMANFRGRPLWELAAQTAETIDLGERVLVVGPNSAISSRPGWRVVENPEAEKGMGTSIAAGVRSLTDCDRVLVMLADMPLVSRAHLARLIAAQDVAFTSYPDGTAGCPAIFPSSAFPQLEGLSGERGARSLKFAGPEMISPSQYRELADVDTARDLAKLTTEP